MRAVAAPLERSIYHAIHLHPRERGRHDRNAKARRNEIHSCDDTRRLLTDLRAKSRRMARGEDRVIQARPTAAPIDNEGLRGQRGQWQPRVVDKASAGQRVRAGQRNQHCLIHQRIDRKAHQIGYRGANERGIHALIAQIVDQLRGTAFLQR